MAFTKRPTDDSDSVQSYIHKIHLIEIFLIVLCVAACLLYLIFKPDFSANQQEKSHLIGITYMTMNNEFYEIVNEQISHRVEAQGDRIVLRDPALSVERQQTQIKEMLDMGIDALVLTPVNAQSLTDILKEAKAKGVKIIIVDTELESPDLADATIISDNYDAGRMIGNYYLKTHTSKSKIVVLTHDEAISGRERVRGFIDEVSKDSDAEIVEKVPCEGQYEIALPAMEKLIEDKVQFDAVFCLNDFAAMGAAAALQKNGMLDDIDLYGVDASPDAKVLINEGMMQASAAQFPTKLGTMAADALYDLLDGRVVEKEVLVPIQLVTENNVSAYTIDRWQ
ncbi:monosaccharide ABC transporter substrate-binding protein, CUT2 family [Lachnospiraceae bacterium KH1T2]|nr:monosaccharide ABC transporter substrate-binding protein, CUT2 family [Lachnospiraceae bacterium KH1T2]